MKQETSQSEHWMDQANWRAQRLYGLDTSVRLPPSEFPWSVKEFEVSHETKETLFVFVNDEYPPLLFSWSGGNEYRFVEALRRLTDEERIKREEMRRPVDAVNALDMKIQQQGGFSTTLKFGDLQKLRAVVKKVHLAKYPAHMITDREADRIIDVLAPATQEFLIKQHLEKQNGSQGKIQTSLPGFRSGGWITQK